MDNLDELKNIIHSNNNIVFFGGAGVSTESGIPDFRSADGLYQNNPETILSHSFFLKNPEIFFEFYKKNLIFTEAKHNAAHKILAKMEKDKKLTEEIFLSLRGKDNEIQE